MCYAEATFRMRPLPRYTSDRCHVTQATVATLHMRPLPRYTCDRCHVNLRVKVKMSCKIYYNYYSNKSLAQAQVEKKKFVNDTFARTVTLVK